MNTGEELEIVDSPERRRYEARLGDRVVGWVEYGDRDGRRALVHTEVDPEMEGRGIGSRLAAGALEDVRRRGVRALVLCPFISSYLDRHHQYDDFVDRRRGGSTRGDATRAD